MQATTETETIERDALIEDLRRVERNLNNSPSVIEYINNGNYPLQLYYTTFDAWNDALMAADLRKRLSPGSYPFELLDDLRDAYDAGKPFEETDGFMRMQDYDKAKTEIPEDKRHGTTTYTRHFETWTNALAAAGLSDEPKRDSRSKEKYDDEELLETIRGVVDSVGKVPPFGEFDSHTPKDSPSVQTISQRFGGWNKAVKTAGFEPNKIGRKVTKKDLIAEIRALADELGHRPTTSDITERGDYAINTYYNHFGSWKEALEAADLP